MILFFAGAEHENIRDLLYDCGVKNILLSFYYLRKRKVDMDDVFRKFDRVVIDSGAFTMFRKDSGTNHQKYLAEYLEFISAHAGKFFWAANYDVDILVGHPIIYKWNELFQQIEHDTKQRICYVVHDFKLPYANLYNYFQRYGYIGVSGNYRSKKDDTGYFGQVFNLSLRHKKFVHGFAMTNFVSFQNFPFYTADSTTYLGGAKFGTTYVWNGAFFETWDYKHKYRRETLRKWCDEWGVDFELFCQDDTYSVNKFNIMSWRYNEMIFNKRTNSRQWWLNGKETFKVKRRQEERKTAEN